MEALQKMQANRIENAASVKEIGMFMNVTNKSVIYRNLKSLIKGGFVEKIGVKYFIKELVVEI